MWNVTTESGSVYEIDTVLFRARRLSGSGDPTPRTADWRQYSTLQMMPSQRLLIVWTLDTPPLADYGPGRCCVIIPTTLTSRVLAINPAY
jgi:hypothetical protein